MIRNVKTIAVVSAIFAFTTVIASADTNSDGSVTDALSTGERRTYTATLEAGKYWTVHASPTSGTGDLDCFVFDEHGNLVGKDEDDNQSCGINGTPKKTAEFTIILVNRGPGYIGYTLYVY
jgi:hypothetical protein